VLGGRSVFSRAVLSVALGAPRRHELFVVRLPIAQIHSRDNYEAYPLISAWSCARPSAIELQSLALLRSSSYSSVVST